MHQHLTPDSKTPGHALQVFDQVRLYSQACSVESQKTLQLCAVVSRVPQQQLSFWSKCYSSNINTSMSSTLWWHLPGGILKVPQQGVVKLTSKKELQNAAITVAELCAPFISPAIEICSRFNTIQRIFPSHWICCRLERKTTLQILQPVKQQHL